MTIKQFRKLIKYLPGNMEIFIPFGEDLISACAENTEVFELETENGIKDVLIVVPCSCHEEIEAEINPELN